MVKCQVVMDALERIAPKRLAEDWDNPGLLVGALGQEVHKILVCLDVSDAVVEQAVACGADMIVAHHPLIFKGIRKLRTDLPLVGALKTPEEADAMRRALGLGDKFSRYESELIRFLNQDKDTLILDVRSPDDAAAAEALMRWRRENLG